MLQRARGSDNLHILSYRILCLNKIILFQRKQLEGSFKKRAFWIYIFMLINPTRNRGQIIKTRFSQGRNKRVKLFPSV